MSTRAGAEGRQVLGRRADRSWLVGVAASTNSTNRDRPGGPEPVRARGSGSSAKARSEARWYEPDAIVATVPMRPSRPLRVARMAARTAGSTTPMTGTGTAARTSSRAAEVAVLQATTRSFTPRSTRWSGD